MLERILLQLQDVKQAGNSYIARCPAHDDEKASLSLSRGDDGRVLMYCHAGCAIEEICSTLGIKTRDLFPKQNGKKEIVATYDYRDGVGNLVYQTVRMHPKDFRQRRADPDKPGSWLWNMKGVSPLPYRLPELLVAIERDEVIFIVEGEKDVLNLVSLGLPATCNHGGAGKWKEEHSKWFPEGASVVILPDNDDPGRDHATKVARQLSKQGCKIKVMELPGLPPKGDVSDWLDAGGIKEELLQLVAEAPKWEPGELPAADSSSKRKKSELQQLLETLHPHRNERYARTDIGNGNLYADCFKNVARYEPDRKKWYIFDGKRWRPDSGSLQIMQMCKRLADELMIFTLSIRDEEERQHYIDFAAKWQRRSYRETILKDAASVHPVNQEMFDSDPYIFNCQNGTLNLRNGEFHDHRPEDMLTKIAGVNYKPGVRSPRWERFINEVMLGDRERAEFLQKCLGYTLSGDTRFECFFILFGPSSRNGKGTCMETFMKLIGDYGRTATPETIAQKQHANSRGPSEDIASLAGARFVNISEPDKRLVLSAALVKTLTGNDKIRCRFLNENGFEFYPQFKLFINTNYLPAVTDETIFSSGRVKVIPFERHFEEHEQDKNLKNELATAENLSGILNWCIDSFRLLKETGFDMPVSVKAATDEYRANSDKIGRFFADEMEENPAFEVTTAAAYARYKTWCADNGFFPENAANFKSMVSKIATVTRKRPSWGGGPTGMVLGYQLRSEFGPPSAHN